MVFNSLPFLVFLPIVFSIYFILPHKIRWVLLLCASYVFYGYWNINYLSLIIISTLVDYSISNYLQNSSSSVGRKIALSTSLVTNLGLLFFFKYFDWFLEDIILPSGILSEDSSIWKTQINFLLPVGISFYTFQTIGYTIDVYQGKVAPEKNPFKFALFVSYFPQLVAGPIERYNHLRNQLFEKQTLSYQNIQQGGRLILFGLFIKMCVADNLANIVNPIYDNSGMYSSLSLFFGMVLFGLQIFADFHGYSLIAIGTARLLG